MNDEINNLIKESFDLMENKKYKEAIELLYPKLSDYTDNIEIIVQIANCYFMMAEYEQSEQYYEKAFEIDNNSTLVLDPLIDLKVQLEKFNEVETYAQNYLNCEDKIYSTQKYLEALTKIKNFEEIVEFSSKANFENFNSESYSLCSNAIIENFKENDEKLELAKSFADKALEIDKNNMSALYALAKYYITKGELEKIEELVKDIPPKQANVELLSIYAYKKYITKDYENAAAFYSKAIELDEKNEILYYNLANSYMQMGWLKEAEVVIKKGLAIKENSIALRLALANIYYMNQEFDKTLLTLSYVEEHEPDNIEMNYLYMYSYAHQNDFVKAQEYAKKLEGKVESSYIDVNFAKIYYELGQKDKAEEYFNKAIEKDPENIDLLEQKASYSTNDEAQKIYDKIIEINPNYVDAYYQKSVLYIYQKNIEEALKYALKSVEMDCNNAEYQYNLARIYDNLGEFDKAIECAKFSLSITPDDLDKYWFLGFMYLEKNEPDAAMTYFKEILAINPSDFRTLSRIAYNLTSYKYYEMAYEYWQKAFRVNPDDYDFIRDYSDFVVEHISAFNGIKLLLNYKNFTDNKNLKIESKNRAKRIIRENKKKLSVKEKLQLMFK